jgi:steroid delta-isomerase-like uncharacterized protein
MSPDSKRRLPLDENRKADHPADPPSALKSVRSYRVAGARLRAWRIAFGWTQHDAAARAGVSDRLIRKAEAGQPIGLNSINLLAQLYSTPERRVTPRELLAEPAARLHLASEQAELEAFVRRWFAEIWNQDRLEAIQEMAAHDCLYCVGGTLLQGSDELRLHVEAARRAFQDLRVDVEQVAARGAWVASHWQATMTHCGPWMGAPPTNKQMIVRGATWMRVEEQLLREGWTYWEPQQALDAPGDELRDIPRR